ncbi:MAG: hypothetical protein KAI17_19275 [Thiotrichaceae bacterium]|nr:hypothetical protein [Thiotrichaceae bacterium]
MLALEGIYQDGQVILTESVSKISNSTKVVVLFIEENVSNQSQGLKLAKLQESTGFAKDILANPAEDVWNDL